MRLAPARLSVFEASIQFGFLLAAVPRYLLAARKRKPHHWATRNRVHSPRRNPMDAVPLGASRHSGSAADGKPGWRLASKKKLALRAKLGACTCRNVGVVDSVDVPLTMLANDAAARAVAFGELRSSIGAEALPLAELYRSSAMVA